jgi:hypothetical protein
VAISASTWRTSTATDTQMIMHALINEAAYMALGHKVDLERVRRLKQLEAETGRTEGLDLG